MLENPLPPSGYATVAVCIGVVTAFVVLQEQKSNQLVQRIDNLQNNPNCRCATLKIDIQKLETIQRNISDLSSKVLALQAKDKIQEAQLQSLGTAQTNQGNKIVVNREQITRIAEGFAALDEKVDEQEERVNSSIRDTAQKFETIQEATAEAFAAQDGKLTEQEEIVNSSIRDTAQKFETIQEATAEAFAALHGTVAEQEERLNSSIKDIGQQFEMIQEAIAANTNQINILIATIRDAYDLETNITRFIMNSELLEAQLRSVNTSVQLQGASIEKLRVDTSRNISEVRERTQDSLDVIGDDVIRNTNELNDARTSLNRRIDEVETKQDTNTALLSQHSAKVSDLESESIYLKSLGIGAVTFATIGFAVLIIIAVVGWIFCSK